MQPAPAILRSSPPAATSSGVLGGGLVVLCLLDEHEVAASRSRAAAAAAGVVAGAGEPRPREIGAWLHIAEDGAVTAYTGKAEVGQNIRTSLSQAVADELRVPIESVRLVMGDTALCPFDAGTFGSRTTPAMAPQLRKAAAAAREAIDRPCGEPAGRPTAPHWSPRTARSPTSPPASRSASAR